MWSVQHLTVKQMRWIERAWKGQRSVHSPIHDCLLCADMRAFLRALPLMPELACYVLDPAKATPYHPYKGK